MQENIFKIFLIVSLTAITASGRETQISTSLLEDAVPDDVNVQPYVRVGQKLYYFGQSKVSWYKAHLICSSMKGSLASFDSQEELTALSDYIVGKYPLDRWWWLSGSDLDSEGDFYWYGTGERIGYADWSAGQPDNNGGSENCVHLWYQKPKFQMNDWICKGLAYYICEADQPKSIILTVF